MPLKSVALIAAICLTTGWLLASLLTPPVANVQVLPDRRPPQAQTTADPIEAGYSEQLRLRLQQAPAPPVPTRNPFVFAPRAPMTASRSTRASEQPLLVVTDAPAPVGPAYALSGMAVTETPEGTVRTAVVSDGRTVHLVKEGDALAGYKVIAITEATVTLEDRAGTQHVLRLP